MNIRPAPESIVARVKARLERAHPGAALARDAVKLVSIPSTPFEATVFCFEWQGKLVLVVELDRPDFPHVYQAATVKPGDAKGNARAMVKGLLGLAQTVRSDARFRRQVVSLNGNVSRLLLPKGFRS